jgi:hypothetical protein
MQGGGWKVGESENRECDRDSGGTRYAGDAGADDSKEVSSASVRGAGLGWLPGLSTAPFVTALRFNPVLPLIPSRPSVAEPADERHQA